MVKIKNSVMYYRSVYYAIFMILFAVLGYLFLDSGFNTKTRVRVLYQDNSDVDYKVEYISNEYVFESEKYLSNMVDSININFNYENVLSEYFTGYYRYNVEAYLIAYEDDITNSLWERKSYLVNEKTEVIDDNKINNIKIEDYFVVDFKEYRDEVTEFIDKYGINLSGYLHIRINIFESLNFFDLGNEYADDKVITINIPLTYNTFKIDVDNLDDVDSYYDFTNDSTMNIVFLIIGAFCLAISLSLIILVIKQFRLVYVRQSKYTKELNKILFKYKKNIVRVKRLYVNKKYNMIYVDSFTELMDVYNRTKKMISFKEIKRGMYSIFLIIDSDDAWIYRFVSDDLD